jgi:hypothetical protein
VCTKGGGEREEVAGMSQSPLNRHDVNDLCGAMLIEDDVRVTLAFGVR